MTDYYVDKNYGQGDPNCPICHGLGYVRYDVPEEHPYFGRVFDCECRLGLLEDSRMARLRKVGGLEHLSDKTFDNFITEVHGLPVGQQDNLRRALDAAVAFAEEPEGWLIYHGGYGSGKTHLAAAIANYRLDHGHSVVFVTAPDLLDHLRGAYSGEGESYSTRFEQVRTAPLLVLDDLGIESPTPWAVEKLYQIINYRYTARLPTVVTTNFEIGDFEHRIRSRLFDTEICQTFSITAPDFRGSGTQQRDTDLNDLSLYSHMTFAAFDLRRDLPPEKRSNLRRARDLALEFAQKPDGWLVFLGGYGSGKTHLAAAIANHQTEKGTQALFVTVPDLLDHLRATYSPSSDVSYDKRFQQVKRSPLLILDDLGTESATPWAREKLYQLFNFRYNTRLPTVITTSRDLEDLDARLVTRMRDKRLCRLFGIQAPAYLGERSRT